MTKRNNLSKQSKYSNSFHTRTVVGQNKNREQFENKQNHSIHIKASQKIDKNSEIDSLNPIQEENEVNPYGIKLLENKLKKQIFGSVKSSPIPEEINQIGIDHLTQQNIYGKKTSDNAPNVNFKFPDLLDSNIGKHFYRLGQWSSEPYISLAKEFSSANIPSVLPSQWVLAPGWTRYCTKTGEVKSVPFPPDKAVVFDVESLVKEGGVPVLATAASDRYWYSWVSPYLIDPEQDRNQLIPWDSETERVIVAHFASFDRSRIQNEYHLKNSKNVFLDTLSLHVAVGGLSSIQRNKYLQYHRAIRDDKLDSLDSSDIDSISKIAYFGTVNSLQHVAKLYCGIEMEKDAREVFIEGTRQDVLDQFQALMDYCATDVQVTHQVYKEILELFLDKCPHPVSFAGMSIMGKAFLPVTREWEKYIENAEKCYNDMLVNVENKLLELTEQALKHPAPQDDPWLCHLDWTTPPLRMTKPKYKKDGTYAKNGEPRPHSRQVLPGYPEWYRSLYVPQEKRIRITTRCRLAPYLLKLKWQGYPIYYSSQHGWTYAVTRGEESAKISSNPLIFTTDTGHKHYEEYPITNSNTLCFFKIPHKDGDEHNVGNPLAKGYISSFEGGIMSSEYDLAQQALQMNAMCAYWISARDRVKSQFVSWQNQSNMMGIDAEENKPHSHYGMIIPLMATMGTVTRRAVESTWMTASNAKKNRIGSELKSLVVAPPGYKIVGADVDSEELWISSLIGDSQFRDHGATAFGWMNLQGTKSEGTDLHSKTANILGISRNNAKVFNYGRIYGAGVKFSVQLLLQFNPSMSQSEAKAKAQQLYKETKGTQKFGPKSRPDKNFWYGGSESFMFNKLEAIAKSKDPRTPILHCGIPNTLRPECVNEQYMTSRVNWVVQSSGVDYLHLLLVSMDYLTKKYDIDARFMLSVHDEVRYLVKENDSYRAAMALQIANLWTRALFSYRLGFTNLPQSVAFFSQVDIDHVLRKEVDLDCVTPSNPHPIPHGESATIYQLVEKLNDTKLQGSQKRYTLPKFIQSSPIPSFITAPTTTEWTKDHILYLKRQNCTNSSQIKDLAANHSPTKYTQNRRENNPSKQVQAKKSPHFSKPNSKTSSKSKSNSTSTSTSLTPVVSEPMVEKLCTSTPTYTLPSTAMPMRSSSSISNSSDAKNFFFTPDSFIAKSIMKTNLNSKPINRRRGKMNGEYI